jgi:hypothetical protein
MSDFVQRFSEWPQFLPAVLRVLFVPETLAIAEIRPHGTRIAARNSLPPETMATRPLLTERRKPRRRARPRAAACPIGRDALARLTMAMVRLTSVRSKRRRERPFPTSDLAPDAIRSATEVRRELPRLIHGTPCWNESAPSPCRVMRRRDRRPGDLFPGRCRAVRLSSTKRNRECPALRAGCLIGMGSTSARCWRDRQTPKDYSGWQIARDGEDVKWSLGMGGKRR